jgi:hypothetical protein
MESFILFAEKGPTFYSSVQYSKVRLARRHSNDLENYLPPAGWRRWSARNKAAVVIAVRSGTLGRAEASERYTLSEDELSEWEEAFDHDGIAGLQAKRR